jgi:hypothetical protein
MVEDTLIQEIAKRLNTTPQDLQRESLKLYLAQKLRVIESELYELGVKYGVKTVAELDNLVKQGKLHEDTTFEDYFKFDNLEAERDKILEILGNL